MSVQRFGRNYRLTIDPKDGGPLIVITPPFTCRFFIKRDINQSINNCLVDIYNLSIDNRRRIFQDRFDLTGVVVNGKNLGPRTFKFEAGYGNLLYTIFAGEMQIASSSREGVDIVTHIESLAGIYDLAASTVNTTLPAGQTLTQVFKYLAGQFPTVSYGYISDFPQVFPRPVVLNGKPMDLIKQYAQTALNADGKNIPVDAFIDNSKIFIMSRTDALKPAASIPVIDASTGLLETPRREQSSISVTTLLDTEIQVNNIVQVNSIVEPVYNGQYKCLGVQHVGVISGAVSGECRSTFFLLASPYFKYKLVQSS